MDDQALRNLVTRAGGGDGVAAELFCQQTWRLIRSAARRRLLQLRAQGVPVVEDSLDDAVQHVYAVLWSGVLWKPVRSSMSGFVYAVAWYRSGDYFTRKATAWERGTGDLWDDEGAPAQDVADPGPGPEELLALQGEVQALAALSRQHLTPREQTIFELRVMQGLDPADIAQILHITAANVSATLIRVRQKLAPHVTAEGRRAPASDQP